MIRVLLADDQGLVRAGFRMILRAEPDIEVVGEAGDGAEAVSRARETSPDVVLMDIRMPGVDGVEATRRIAVTGGPRVLVLTTFDLDEYVYEALRAGASGFLLKDVPEEQLVAAIRVVAAGGSLFAPTVTRRLIEEFARRARPPERAARSSTSSRRASSRCSRLVARGLSNAEIAARARGQRAHDEDPRRQRALQARPAQPRAGRGARLRDGAGDARSVTPAAPAGHSS